jgi:hypothetical protein
MSAKVRSIAVVLILALPLSAGAHGLRLAAAHAVVYYCPAPVVWLPAANVAVYGPPVVAMPSAPVPCPPATRYAPPVAAPPSDSPVTPGRVEPTMPKIPDVSESRSSPKAYYDAYPVASRGQPAGESPSIRVWNLSGQELRLKVNGEALVLRHGQQVGRTVPRQFVWQVLGREAQTERIPEGESALELVVRR